MSLHDPALLPVHPRTGLTAIGLRRNGEPIWPALGGSGDTVPQAVFAEPKDADTESADADSSEEDDGETDVEVDESDEPDDDADKPLGPAGEKALNAEKTKRREEATRRRAAERELAETRAEVERLKRTAQRSKDRDNGARADKGKEPDIDLDALRTEAAEEARAEARLELLGERVADRVEILAARRFQDAEDALAHLMRTHEVSDFLDDDQIDVEAINEALDELLERKPYLASAPAQGGETRRRFKGSGDGGAKPNKPARARDLGEAVARKLNPT